VQFLKCEHYIRVKINTALLPQISRSFFRRNCCPIAPTISPIPKALAVDSNVITVVTDDWCPYSCTPGSEYPGYMIEVAAEIFKKAGYQIKYEYIP
jgi:hypothetical protein